MAYTIDTTSYRKDTVCQVGQGYSMRPGGIAPTTIVIHTTNSPHKDTTFPDEATYLRTSHDVGAHFLVGKQGQIAQILAPALAAWQAGGLQKDGTWTAQPAFANDHSIGIESHVSVGEQWTGTQRDALTWIVRRLMTQYRIAPEQIETHRKIALPVGRKTDPEGWPNDAFYAWRAALVTAPPAPTPPKSYRVVGVPVFERSDLTGRVVIYLTPLDSPVTLDAQAPLPNYAPNAAHVVLKDGSAPGFVDMRALEVTG